MSPMDPAPGANHALTTSLAYRRFVRRLVAVARRAVPAAVRSRVEPEDVVQSVFRSLIRRGVQPVSGGWNGLWGLLLVMTRRKCRRQARDACAARRDVRSEVPAADRASGLRYPGPDSTPHDDAIAAELLARLAAGLDDRDRAVLGFHVQGFTQFEIADRLGCAVRTVRRSVDRIRDRYAQLAGPDSHGVLSDAHGPD